MATPAIAHDRAPPNLLWFTIFPPGAFATRLPPSGGLWRKDVGFRKLLTYNKTFSKFSQPALRQSSTTAPFDLGRSSSG